MKRMAKNELPGLFSIGRGLLLVGALGLQACEGDITDEPVDQVDNPIIGGVADNGDRAVIALFGQRPEGGGSLCTTTLISPTVLLSAAHCVHPALAGAGVRFTAFLDPVVRAGARTIPVRQVRFHPGFNPRNPFAGNDFAVAILQRPITNVSPIPINRAALGRANVGTAVRLVGYGNNNGGSPPEFRGRGAGTKRQVTTRLVNVRNLLIGVGDSNRGTCQGDSGGPAFMRIGGVERVVGVTSFGQAGCRGTSQFGRVDRQTAFLDQFLGENDVFDEPEPVQDQR
jgi:secreted trypsin-like serine protease